MVEMPDKTGAGESSTILLIIMKGFSAHNMEQFAKTQATAITAGGVEAVSTKGINQCGRRSSMSFWHKSKRRAWISGVLAGTLFLGVGALQGRFAVIWKKAVMICLECMGSGGAMKRLRLALPPRSAQIKLCGAKPAACFLGSWGS